MCRTFSHPFFLLTYEYPCFYNTFSFWTEPTNKFWAWVNLLFLDNTHAELRYMSCKTTNSKNVIWPIFPVFVAALQQKKNKFWQRVAPSEYLWSLGFLESLIRRLLLFYSIGKLSKSYSIILLQSGWEYFNQAHISDLNDKVNPCLWVYAV